MIIRHPNQGVSTPNIKQRPKPKCLILNPSMQCNRKCLFCLNAEKNNMTLEECRQLLSRRFKERVEDVRIAGGEPTLRTDLSDIIRSAKQIGYPLVGIITNGSKHDDKLVSGLKESGLTYAGFSLFSHKEDVFDMLTQKPGSFRETVGGIHAFHKHGIYTYLNIVMMEPNHRDLPDILRFIKKEFWWVRECMLFFMQGIGRAKEDHRLHARYSELRRPLEEAIDVCIDSKIDIIITDVPFCCLSSRYWIYLRHSLNIEPSEDIGNNKAVKGLVYMKPESCRKCSLDKRCNGVLKSYTDIFGCDELVPIRGDIK